MKILHVLDHSLPVQSGYAFRSAAILREQRRLGWRTIQVTGPKQGGVAVQGESVDGIDYLRVAGGGWVLRLPAGPQLEVLRALRVRLRELVASERPDLIQAHSPCLNGLAAMGLGPPLVYEFRSSWEDAAVSTGTTTEGSLRYRLSRALETFVLRRADAVTTICEGLRQDAIVRGVPPERIAVIPNAVDVDAFEAGRLPAADRAKARFGLTGRYVLGFVGSFFAWEGLCMLIEALLAIRVERPDVALLLVGGGVDEPALRQRVADQGLESNVVFAGALPHDEVGAAYAAIDLLVYPRLRMRLTDMVTPLKPLEAMAMGKPLVASDVGGHRELIEDGITGLLFRAGDCAALTGALARLMADHALADRLAGTAAMHVREHRTWYRAVQGYEPVYHRLLRSQRE